jgi:hypothetical protein
VALVARRAARDQVELEGWDSQVERALGVAAPDRKYLAWCDRMRTRAHRRLMASLRALAAARRVPVNVFLARNQQVILAPGAGRRAPVPPSRSPRVGKGVRNLILDGIVLEPFPGVKSSGRSKKRRRIGS